MIWFSFADGNNPAYGEGVEIISPYVDRVNALPHMTEKTDFFGNPLGGRTSSIGAHNPYAVTFDSNGGSEVMMKFAIKGGTITEPTALTKDQAVSVVGIKMLNSTMPRIPLLVR